MILNAYQAKDYVEKLSEKLTKKQADAIEAVAGLLDDSGKANLKQVLEACYRGKNDDEALNSLRGVRKQINDAAKQNGVEFSFLVDDNKRSKPEQRMCWFEGADLSAERMEQMQKDLLAANPEYRLENYTPPLARSRYRIFVSSSDNRGAEAATDQERVVIEDFLRRLRLSLKGLNRHDLADGMYHFREQQENLMFERIEKAMNDCEVGLLLFSKPYLASKYVKEYELPRFDPLKYRCGEVGTKDAIPLLLSPCYGNDPAKINDVIGLSGGGGLQILRHKDKMAFSECDESAKEHFVEFVAERLSNKLPPIHGPGDPLPKRRDHLDTFTSRHWHKLINDRVYCPDEFERLMAECGNLGRVASSVQEGCETSDQPAGSDALNRLVEWAVEPNSAHVHALLGDLGSGKTFTCRMLALALLKKRKDGDTNCPLPIYIDLREVGFVSEWQGVPKLDQILTGWLKNWMQGLTPDDAHGLNVEAIKRLSENGAVWIFDGFDEISSHLPRNGDNAFFKELLRPVAPEKGKSSKSKVLISCRSHYFPTLAKQNATLLEEARGVLTPGTARSEDDDHPELICDSTLLLPFDEEQIKSYLGRTLGDTEATRAMEVIAGIHNLTELSRQPYLLRLIRGQIARLELMKSQGKPVNAASLYGLFVADWLQRDEGKHTIEPEDKLRLMERLAARMWAERQRGWTFEQLQRWALSEMEQEPDWRFRYQPHSDLIAKDLHTAAFIVRYGESSFRFIHTSMQEYFVAAHLLRGLREQRLDHWDIANVSPEALTFLADLWQLTPAYEHTILSQTQRQLHDVPPTPNAALLALDYLLTASQKGWPHILPATLDLSGTDIGQRSIAGQPGHPWVFTVLRLNNVNGPQLKMAHLDIRRLEAKQARFVGSRWEQCRVRGAHLEFTDLSGAQLRQCDWQVTSLQQICMRHTELRFTRFILPSTIAPSDIVGPVWWLNRDPCPTWALLPTYAPEAPFSLAKAGHNGSVTSVAWRNDGARLASAGRDNSVRIWDAISGVCLVTLEGHESEITSVAWSSDGTRLASAGRDRTVRIWDAMSGVCFMILDGHESGSTSVAWSSDGTRLASAGRDKTVRIWDAMSGTCLMTLEAHESVVITSVTWRSDGRRLASAGWDKTVRIWDATSGACLMTLDGHESGSTSVAWSSDGARLASAGWDNTVRIWDATSGACLMTLEGHKTLVINSVAWSNDGTRLASAGDDTVRIWDAMSGTCLVTLEGHEYGVDFVAWSSDDSRLASAGWDPRVRIWDSISGACLMILEGYEYGINSVAWSSDGRRLASAGRDETVRIWDAISGVCLMTLVGHAYGINSVAWSNDGSRLASAGWDNTVHIWDAISGVNLLTLEGYEYGINSVAWSSDDRRLASAGRDETVRIWDATSGVCLMTLEGHGSAVINSVAWSSDGTRLASAGRDKMVCIWDAINGACLMALEGHESEITSVAWSNDGTRLASAGRDKTVIWDATSGVCLMTLEGHEYWINSVAWSSDDTQLASAGDNRLHIWDAISGVCLMTLKGHEYGINSVAWSRDGRRLATAGRDGRVCVWDAVEGRLLRQNQAINDAVAIIDANGAVIETNDACWSYLARMGTDPETGERMWLPVEVSEICGELPA